MAVYYVIATAEASSNLARFDGVKFGFRAKETKDLLELYMKTRQEGFGAGSEAADHAGDLCAQRRVL